MDGSIRMFGRITVLGIATLALGACEIKQQRDDAAEMAK